MTLNFLLPAAWGLVLLVAFIGYGKLLRRLLCAGESPGWANEAAWGMAFVVVLGGWLNLFRVISPPLVLLLIAVGVVSSLFDAIQRRATASERLKKASLYLKEHPYLSLLKLVGYGSIVALTGLQYLGSVTVEVHHTNYIVMDDLRGYFLFPKQMLEAGGITADPFNFMRLGNGLGGQAILHAFILALFDFFNILLMETGISLIICVGLVWRIAANRNLCFAWRWLLALLFLCLPYYPSLLINTSSFVSGMLMLLALFAILDRDDISTNTPIRNACLVGMLAASACALKTTYLPPVALILSLSYVRHLIASRSKKEPLLEAGLCVLFTILMLLPWMLALMHSSGTLLYPIFGTGFDEYNYGNYISDVQVGAYSMQDKLTFIYLTYFSRDIYLMLFIAGIAGLVVAKLRPRAAAHSFALGTLAAALIVLLQVDVTKTVSLNRYLFGGVYVALTAILMELMAVASRRGEAEARKSLGERSSTVFCDRRKIAALLTLAGIGYLFFWQFGYAEKTWNFYRFYLNILPDKMACQGDFIPDDWRARYRQAQETVPAGETILSRDTFTVSYDFGRNTIYSLTLPGSCSPPPGMPYFSDAETLADYLLAEGIRYVAYTYATDGGFPITENLYRIRPDAGYFNRIYQRAAIALSKGFNELGATRTRIYDDGTLFILDLKRPAQIPRVYRAPNYFQNFKILTPASARTTGFDRNKIWTNGQGTIEGIHYQLERQDRILVLNTFGYHPWKGDIRKLQLVVSVNGRPLPLTGLDDRSYYFSLAPVRGPITRISIDSTTFVPLEEQVRFGKDDDRKTLGIDVDTLEIKSMP